MSDDEVKYEITDTKSLEQKLKFELAKIDDLKPLFPVDDNDVKELKTTSLNKAIIIASFNYPRVNQYPLLALKFKLLIAINKTILFVGHKVQDIDFLYRGVFEHVRNDAKNLTIEELEIAFKKGAMDEYGEWHGLSAMTFCKWINAYVDQTKREAMAEKQKIKKKSLEPEPTEEELTQSRIDWLTHVIGMYDDYVKSDAKKIVYYDYQNRLYDFLARLRIISLSKKKREMYKERAKYNLRKITRRKIDELDIRIEAKKIALSDFFYKCKSNKKDLSKMIEEKDGWEFLKKHNNL